MLNFYERLALKIKAREPGLSISAVVLFFGVFLGSRILPEKLFFIVLLTMLWVSVIALLGHMFAPQIDRDGNQTSSRVRGSSAFMRVYALVFISVCFLVLILISVNVAEMLAG